MEISITEVATVVGIIAALATTAVIVIGPDRIRRIRVRFRLAEPEPYFVARTDGRWLEKNDTVVGPILKAEREAGNVTSWPLAQTPESPGYEYLRTERRKIMYRSKTLAHSEVIVLMVRRWTNVNR